MRPAGPTLGVLMGGPLDGLEIPAYTDTASFCMALYPYEGVNSENYTRTTDTDAQGRAVYIYLKPAR